MKTYIIRFWKINILVLIVNTFAICAQIIGAFLQMNIFNSVVSFDLISLIKAMVQLALALIISFLFSYLGEILQAKAIQRMNNSLRSDVSNTLSKMEFQQFHKKEIGDYVSWYTNDINQIEQMGFVPFFTFVTQAIQLTLAIIALCLIHWFLAVLVVGLAVLMLLVPQIFHIKIENGGEILSKSQELFVRRVKDILSGFEITKTFVLMNRFKMGMESASDDLETEKCKFSVMRSKYQVVILVLNVIGQMVTMFSVAMLAIMKFIPIKSIYGSGNITAMVFNATEIMLKLRVNISASKPFFSKLTPNSGTNLEKGNLPPIQHEIRLNDISYSYGDKMVLENINISFKIGKKYAIVGSSGSGKTTLLKILMNQIQDYEGIVQIDGNDIRRYQSDSIYQYLTYIGQDVYLFDSTIRDNITLEFSFNEEQINDVLEESALTQDVCNAPDGLETKVGENGRNLSGGQKQRISIARALIHNKAIIIMDEGTSALDQKNAKIVEEKLLKNTDITVLLISHHLSDSSRCLFDEIVELPNHRLSQQTE